MFWKLPFLGILITLSLIDHYRCAWVNKNPTGSDADDEFGSGVPIVRDQGNNTTTPATTQATTTRYLTSPRPYSNEVQAWLLDACKKQQRYIKTLNYYGKPVSKVYYLPNPINIRRFHLCDYDPKKHLWHLKVFECNLILRYCDKIQKCVPAKKFNSEMCQIIGENERPLYTRPTPSYSNLFNPLAPSPPKIALPPKKFYRRETTNYKSADQSNDAGDDIDF